MACHCLKFKDENHFKKAFKEKEISLVVKLIKCVLSAVKRKKSDIEIFEITFDDGTILDYSVNKNEYNSLLKKYMDVLIEYEEFELCAEIVKIIDKRRKKEIQSEEENK